MKKKMIIGIPAVLAVLVLIVLVVTIRFNRFYIDFSIPDEETVTIEYGDSYVQEPVRAYYRGTIWQRRGRELEVAEDGWVDVKTFGTYEVTYSASCEGQTKTVRRKVVVEDKKAPVIKLVSDPEHYTSPASEYQEEGYSAYDNFDGDVTDQVVREARDGVVTYTVTDSMGNTASVTRNINYKDVVAPVISLNGRQNITIKAGKKYADQGCTATDDCDGDLTDQVKVSGSVNTGKPGAYQISYYVEDSYGNSCEVLRQVSVVDTKAPKLALKGDATVYVPLGGSFEDPGYTAKDNCDGDLSQKVTITGNVKADTKGIYPLKYSVEDTSGNVSTASRTVYVYEKQKEVDTRDPGDKVVYLTFDDGPGKYTARLLKVLDKYNVKVTFFITNQYKDYQKLIKKEYKKGHTVALHSYSHDYSKIYASQEAFFQDIERMGDICYNQTEMRPTIIRFPGGSSNSISARYCKGIMTDLTKATEIMGYQYCDWNVASGDAGETTSTARVVSNVIDGMKNHKVSVVLQHDVKEFSVNAVEEIIAWGLANGYTFLPLDETSPMIHHGLNN